ncbi:hypothetical protein M9458_055650, partial [Cirrhinus mrigala]
VVGNSWTVNGQEREMNQERWKNNKRKKKRKNKTDESDSNRGSTTEEKRREEYVIFAKLVDEGDSFG